jgi:PAS domain S-box-containing protein
MSQFANGRMDRHLWNLFRTRTYMNAEDEQPVIDRVLQERRPVLLEGEDLSLVPERWVEPFGVAGLLVVPLVSKDSVIGIMGLDRTETGDHFAEDQIHLAMTISSQVAVAIENAQLYAETAKARSYLETILEEAFTGIMVVGSDLRIQMLNPAVGSILGRSGEAISGKALSEILSPELWAKGSLLVRAIASGERTGPEELKLEAKDGSRDVLMAVAPVGDGYLLSFADITRLKEVERLKSNIVANISHELRAPLASIKAYTELLLENLDRDDQSLRQQFLEIIDRETDWLAELINDFLDLSRLESEQATTQKEMLSVVEIVEGVAALLAPQLQEHGVELQIQLQPKLPLLYADKEQMAVLVKNLMGNAIKFSRYGGQVWVNVRQQGDDLVIQVRDQGIGIAPEEMDQLFTKFFRSKSARAAQIRGTGLGLALVKEVIDAHNGSIAVDSSPGEGSVFTAVLPVGGDPALEGEPLPFTEPQPPVG